MVRGIIIFWWQENADSFLLNLIFIQNLIELSSSAIFHVFYFFNSMKIISLNFNVLFLSLIAAMFYLWMLHCSFYERRQKLSVFGEVFLQKVRYFLIRKSAGVISIFIQRKDIKSVNVNWHSRAKRIDQVRKFDILSV